MKITKRTREQAALICAIAASTPRDSGLATSSSMIVADLGGRWRGHRITALAWSLSITARAATSDTRAPRSRTQESDAEAEAMLRCNWSPK